MKHLLLSATLALAAATNANAAICDLSSAGSTCSNFGGPTGAIFTNVNPQPTGTGFIDPFLRLQNNQTEQGYNTSQDWTPNTNPMNFQFDQKNPSFNADPNYFLENGQFKGYTRALALSEVPIVTIGGTAYREFWLDINEPNSSAGQADLSLDQLQIFLSNSATLGVQGVSDYNSTSRQLAGLSAVYDMDAGFANNQANAGNSNWVHLNYDLGHGSGSGDMVVYIPNSLFVGGSFVYLYSAFGSNYASGDGFEEWWVNKSSGGGGGGGQGAVPEPASLALLGSGVSLVLWKVRRRRTA